MTEGNVELVLDYCTEYWNGTEPCRLSSRVRMTHSATEPRVECDSASPLTPLVGLFWLEGVHAQIRERILTFYTSARARDMQCIALAYSPLHIDADHPLLASPTRSLWIQAPPEGPGDLRSSPVSVRAHAPDRCANERSGFLGIGLTMGAAAKGRAPI